ncbi:hypothetical protein ABKV19_022312 [Rosa sericea]
MAAVTVASVIVLFFLPLGAIRNAVGQPVELPVGQPYYQYLQFVLQYPRTVNQSSDIEKRFTIHGLWPSNYSKDQNLLVRNCSPEYPAEILLEQLGPPLEKNLDESWPDVVNLNNSNFWTKQYRKHGSCANHTFIPQDYFRKADDLYRKHWNGLYNLFVDGGIVPGKPNNTSIYMNILVQNATGKKIPRLRCEGKLLKEVVICYNKTATEIINCPSDIGENCVRSILIPTGISLYGPTILVFPTILVLSFSLPLGLIIFKYGPSYIKSKLA